MYQNINKIYHAAIYVRLSKEDGDISSSAKLESNSISNQKALILDFLKDKKDIEVVSVRVDDGYSGSNFERPAFQAMLEDIRHGIVDCVVVKDLSRFGREYIDSGKYIERLFPALGVRFIAINDNYDSLKGKNQADEIIIPFKNLINDAYCRDISIKIRSNLEIKRKKGECVTPFVAFGYRKTKTDKHAEMGKRLNFRSARSNRDRKNMEVAAKRWIKKKHPTFDGDVYVENIRCFLDISREELEKRKCTVNEQDITALIFSQKHLEALYLQCLMHRRNAMQEVPELKGLSETCNRIYKLQDVDVLFQCLLMDQMDWEEGKLYVQFSTVYLLLSLRNK